MSQDDFFATLGMDEPHQSAAESPHAAPDSHEESNLEFEGRRGRRRAIENRKRRRRRRLLRNTLVLLIVIALVGVVGYKAWDIVVDAKPQSTAVSDYSGTGSGEAVVTIPDGATGAEIGEILHKAGVVASVAAFTDAYAANANASKIQSGTYTLKLKMSAANAVAALLDPTSKSEHTLNIPEGFTKAQVKDRLVSVAGFTAEEVDAAFKDTAAIGLPDAAGGNVEGWLAPLTYDVPENATATDVVAAMVAKTVARLQAAGVAEADYEQVLLKASIVEREVASQDYYGQVARVIENRLADVGGETGGRLQMDSTVLYGLGRTGGIPTSAEIADPSNAYNTYQHAGLPPSPIANPGEAAIKAVLNPPAGNWLYFVTVNLETGETLFATTNAEQAANTEKLKEYCKEHADICSGGN